jgi:short-subunit dehydrogenase
MLAHELRESKAPVDAALLVPGWVHTKLTSNGASATGGAKPDGAWTPEETVDYMLKRLDQGSFYIVCPDNETSEALDKARMSWSTGDLLEDRPARSR